MDSSGGGGVQESELFLQWGNRKRNRCARTNKDPSSKPLSDRSTRTITATFIHDHHHSRPASTRFFTREDDSKASAVRSGPRKSSSSSPENYYTTRGSVVNGAGEDGVGKKKNNSGGGNGVKLMSCNNNGGVEINKTGGGGGGGHVWPKLYLGLSNKEKEEDFMAMKGCKPPHRPKKRPKGIQRSVLLVCPGGWLADMCQERYEVREKKSSKKRPRGLKAMGSLESDSE